MVALRHSEYFSYMPKNRLTRASRLVSIYIPQKPSNSRLDSLHMHAYARMHACLACACLVVTRAPVPRACLPVPVPRLVVTPPPGEVVKRAGRREGGAVYGSPFYFSL
jgi:hypothetical protein